MQDAKLDPFDALRRELRSEPPAGFAALEEDRLHHLASTLAGARAAQRDALVAAIDDGLAFIPRVLRSGVKKVLFG